MKPEKPYRFRSFTLAVFGALTLLVSFTVPPRTTAQDVPDIESLYAQAVRLANSQKKYAEALSVAEEIITRFGPHAAEDFGAKFGTVYYLHGICLFHMKKYDEAYSSFEKCHKEFPNSLEPKSGPKLPNTQWKRSVYFMAACRQKQESWEEAIKIYNKFRSLRPERNEYPNGPATLEINVATCHIKKGDVKKGQSILETTFRQKEKLRAKATALYQGFLTLVGGWIEKGKEWSEEDANGFIDRNIADLHLSPWEIARYKFNWQTYALAKDVSAAGMEGVGLRMLALIPETEAVIAELKARREAYSKRNEKLEQEIAIYQKEIDDGNPVDAYALLEQARALEARGDSRGAFAIYDHLAYSFKKCKHRPEILYNATRGAALIRDMITVQHHGLTFLAEFPRHKLKDQVSALLLEQLFFNGEYEKCLTIALDLRKGKQVGSKERDLPDFVYGGSLFYLGQYGDAQPEVDSHVEHYPDSRYREHALYHQAGNLVKLFKYPLAARKLDAFVEEYPDSRLMDLVLYDRATCHYGMDQLESCLEVVEKLQADFKNSQVFDRSLILQGDVAQLKEEYDKATGLYTQARDMAVEQRHSETEENALFQLISVAIAQEKWDEAVALYEEFMEKFEGGFFEPNVIVVAMPALEEKGHGEDALSKLEKIIIVLGERYDVSQLERALASYARIYGDKNGPAALVHRLAEFPGVPVGNNVLRAWLIVTRIGVLEDTKNKKKITNIVAETKVAYDDLMALPRRELSNYILIKVAQNLLQRGRNLEAIEWFEEVLARSDPSLKDFASLGVAQIKAQSASEKIQNEAIPLFREVIQVYKTPALQGDAHLGLGRLLFKQGKHQEALDEALITYMNQKEWRKARAEASWMLGRSLEAVGNLEDARSAYVNVYFLYPGQLEYSTDAYLRTALLHQKEGNKEDAYKTLTRMILSMGHLKDDANNISKAKQLHAALAAELGKNAEEDTRREPIK